MKLPQQWLPIIQKLYQDLTTGKADDPLNFREHALGANLLPLAWDMSGFFGIGLDGTILGVTLGDMETPTEISKEHIINGVLFRGSKLYPELAPLVPCRPNDAKDCPFCKGAGVVLDLPDKLKDSVICFCGGLGWIPGHTKTHALRSTVRLAELRGQELAICFKREPFS